MANTKFSTSSINQGLVKSRSMLVGNAAFDPNSYESIASVTATGSTTTISITSIPNTFTDLQLRVMLRGTYNDNDIYGYFTLNNTQNLYTPHFLVGNGNTAYAQNTSPTVGTYSYVPTGITPWGHPASNALANTYSIGVLDILDYANTSKLKTISFLNGYSTNSSSKGVISLVSSLFNSTNPITSIEFQAGANNVAAGSTFSLYGIKG